MAIMSKLTAAYIAGLTDGEGYLGVGRISRNNKSKWTVRRKVYYRSTLVIANTNKEIIDWLKSSFGGCVRITTEGKWFHTKPVYQWTLDNNPNLIPFLKKIYPYLRIKKQQAELLFKFYKTFNKENYKVEIVQRKYSDGSIREGHSQILKSDIWETRENIWREMSQLNSKGKRILHAERPSEATPIGDAMARPYENIES